MNHIRALKRAIMELPTSNRKKVIDIWLTGFVAKIDPFSIFLKVISRKPLDLHRWKFAQICFQALSASVPNFIEIGGGSRKFSKKLVDLTRNDPGVTAIFVRALVPVNGTCLGYGALLNSTTPIRGNGIAKTLVFCLDLRLAAHEMFMVIIKAHTIHDIIKLMVGHVSQG